MTEYNIRIQIIASANDDGTEAANITSSTAASRIAKANETLGPAKIKFIFDPATDFLKINNTTINRDFTPLEPPNVGADKWDHEPVVDSATHSKARTEICKLFTGKLVIIYRNRKKLSKGSDGKWSIVSKGGGSSGSNAHFVNMSTSSKGVDLGHEIGHYLQLPHTFISGVGTVEEAAAKIKAYVDAGNDKADGLNALDGDSNVLSDTPADCAGSIFEDEGLEVCGPTGQINIPVQFGNTTKNYTLEPDRNLVMSYFKGCSATGDKTISPQQARRIRDGLELRNRHDLICIRHSFKHNFIKTATANAGGVTELDAAMVKAGRIVTAVRDNDGNLKVIAWDISSDGKKITRRSSGTAGAIKKVAVCGLGGNLVATSVITSSDIMKIILWEINQRGGVVRRGDAEISDKVTDVACCTSRYSLGNNFMATAVRKNNGDLRIDVWDTFISGDIKHRTTDTAGAVNKPVTGVSTPKLNISHAGVQSLLVSIRDGGNDLKTILWEFNDDEKLVRLGSSALGSPKVGKIAACNLYRELSVSAVEDKNKNLKLVAYSLPDDGRFIEMKGTASAGNVKDIAICRAGIEMAVTAVKTQSDKLKLILWYVTGTGDNITRLCDIDTVEEFSRLAVCSSNLNQVMTVTRNSSGNLRLLNFKIGSKLFAQKSDYDIFYNVFKKIKSTNRATSKIAKSIGGECET